MKKKYIIPYTKAINVALTGMIATSGTFGGGDTNNQASKDEIEDISDILKEWN